MKKDRTGYIVTLFTITLVIVLIIVFGAENSYFVEAKSNSKFDIGVASTTTTTTTTTKTIATKRTTRKTTTKVKVTTKKTNTSTSTKVTSTTTRNPNSNYEVIDQRFEYIESTSYKYGVKIDTKDKYLVMTYSNGEKSQVFINSRVTYDKSGYNGTTETLKPEALPLSKSNKNTYKSMLEYVNEYRESAGVEPLKLDDNLSQVATIRALELAWSGDAEDISHTRPNGTSWSTVYKEMNYNYKSAGENIAAGQRTVESVSTAWKNSPGHYKNMVNSKFTKVGFGYVDLNGTKYWVQLFAN